MYAYIAFLHKHGYREGEMGLEHNIVSIAHIKPNIERFTSEYRYFDDILTSLHKAEKKRGNNYKKSANEDLQTYKKFTSYTYDTHLHANDVTIGFTKRVLTRLHAFSFDDYKENAEKIVHHRA